MSGWQEAICSLCLVSVIGAAVRLLLPSNSLGANMKMVINLIITAALISSVLSLFDYAPIITDDNDLSLGMEAETYLTDRVANSLTEETEKIVKDTLQQFGIKHGQISIDFNKSKYGNITLKHILVYIPKEYSSDKQSIKNILLKKFDVFCDVAVMEENDEKTE